MTAVLVYGGGNKLQYLESLECNTNFENIIFTKKICKFWFCSGAGRVMK